METTILVWALPLVVLAYLALLAQYLKHQDRPSADMRGHTPAE